MGKQIYFNADRKRELVISDKNINEYYRELAELWNKFQSHIDEPTDGRTNFFRDYNEFYWKIFYLFDMIAQTKKDYEDKIRDLEKELNKWTVNQHGRKPKLSEEQKKDIRAEKASGISNIKLAKQYNVSEGTIRNVLKERK